MFPPSQLSAQRRPAGPCALWAAQLPCHGVVSGWGLGTSPLDTLEGDVSCFQNTTVKQLGSMTVSHSFSKGSLGPACATLFPSDSLSTSFCPLPALPSHEQSVPDACQLTHWVSRSQNSSLGFTGEVSIGLLQLGASSALPHGDGCRP